MKIAVKIVSEVDVGENPSDRRAIHIETHSRRNDSFNVQKVDDVMEGDEGVFLVPVGGRLVINTPQTNEEIVYDKEQGAAVRATLQNNDEGKADAVDMDALAKTKQDEADLAKKQADAARQGQPGVTNTTPQTTGQSAPTKPTAPPTNPVANTPNPSHPSTPAQTPPQQRK